MEAAAQVGPPLTCQVNTAVTPTLRAEGLTDRIGDIVMVCSGGTPTAAGSPLPQYNITVTLNTSVTSRILDPTTGASEALLTVDEPGAQFETGVPSIQLACATPLTGCSIVSNGGEPYDGTPGRPNVFEGVASGDNSVTFYGVPLTAAGSSGVGPTGSTVRVLRMVNIRADAAAFWNAVGTATPPEILASVGIVGSPAITVASPSGIAGFTQFGLVYQTRNAGNTAVAGPVSLSGCVAAIPCGAAVVRFAENFGTAFLTQIGATPQNIPGVVYNSESGFFSSALAASNPNLATAGLADAGTRLKATFQGVPAGAQLWVALNTIVPTANLSAALTANEAGPLSPVAASGTIGSVPAAQLTVTNGSAAAVWEVTGESPASIDTFDFQVWVVFPTGSTPSGTLTIQGSLAPNTDGGAFPLVGEGIAQDVSFPEPRFTSSAPPSLAIAETDSGNLSQGEVGASFTFIVSNTGSATSGAITVQDLLPSGILTVTSLTGSGWSCIVATLICTRSDALAQGQSYPPIFLTGNVLANAPALFVNLVLASGGGSNTAAANDAVTLIVAPQLSSLLPSATFVNSSGFTLAASGANIVSGASIEWTAPGGAQIALPGNFISSAQLQASIPASLLTTPGVAQVAILNPSGASSGSLPFLITNNSQNIPALTSLSPNHTAQNSSPFTLTANGSSFQAGASIEWTTTNGTSVNLPASFVGAAQVQATVPANLLTTAGTAQVAILNPGFGLTGQQAFLITGVNASQQPQLTSIDPNTVLKNSAAFTVTANGSNFLSGASVWWTAPTGTTVTLPATFISSAQVQATVPANLLTTPGTAQVAILNPGSLLSASQNLAITTSGPSVQPLSVTPAAGAGSSQVFSMQYLDTSGAADLSTLWVWFNANFNTVSSANSCLAYYARATNQLFLLNDAGTAYSSAAPGVTTAGAAVTLSNSRCSINMAAASATPSGTNLTLNLPVTFAAGFAGTKNIYMYAAGSIGDSGWQTMGTWTVPAPGGAVSAVSVTPNSGSGAQQAFALQYADLLGATDLSTVWVWFTSNFNTATSANSCLAYYARATNQLLLLNDAGTAYSSAAPGAAVTLSNSQCSINMAAASATPSGTNLTVNLPVTFAPGYAGTKSIYMYAAGSIANSGWQSLGTWTVPATVVAVSAVSVTPNSGSGAQQAFALQYADSLGATDLSTVWVWFTANFNTATSANSCLAYYARAANQLFLLNDAGTAYSSATPGAAVTLSNSQCSINMAAASVTPSGTNLTVNLPVTFTAAYAGTKSTYMYAAGSSANSGWQAMGTWTVPATVAAVTAASVTPNSGSGAQRTFALQYADSLGAADLSTVWIWFTSNFNTATSANSCLAYYARAANQIFLLNDAGTAFTSAAPGAAVTLSNSQCSMNAAGASVTPSGTNLTVNLPVTFAPGYAGTKSIYMYAAGSIANSGWQAMGTWTVPATVTAVSAVSVTPNSGSGAQQAFALQYADSLGATDLSTVWVWFTSNFNSVSSANSCIAYYARATNQLLLLNDAGEAYSSATPGAAVTLSNSQCSINMAAASATPSGTNLTVNLPVTFTAAYAGTKSTYMYAAGSGANSGWQSMGTWTVPATVTAVTAVSVTPNSGSGAQQTFALQYADPLAATDLSTVWVWFTSNFNTATSANSCLLYYARATNQLLLLNDAGTAYSSATPGAAVTLSNSQCSINAAAASVTASGTGLTVNLPVTFTPAYAGTKSTYMFAAGSGANSGWQSMGTWTVP
jgi:uncharacterized repeat protein (TIGR01451 family)